MSHVTDLKLRIKDLDALDKTLAEQFPELELRRDKKTFAWWGTFVGDSTPPPGRDPKDYGKCEHAIGFKGKAPRNGSGGEYEIGLVKALDGDGYELMADTYGSTGARISERMPKLKREYAATVATQKAVDKLSRHGWRVQREELPGNRIRLKLKKR